MQAYYEDTNEDKTKAIFENLKKARNTQLKENKGESFTTSGENRKAAFRGNGQGLKTSNRLLDLDVARKELHDAWKDAMEKEEAIVSYQLPEGLENL